MQSVHVESDAAALVSRLPNVTDLQAARALTAEQFGLFAAFSAVMRLTIPSAALSAASSMPMRRSVSELIMLSKLTADDAKSLLALPNVTDLTIRVDRSFPIASLSQLRKLSLQTSALPRDAFPRLRDLESLVLLPGRDFEVSVASDSVAFLSHLTKLRELRLPRLRFTDDAKDPLASLSTLPSLTTLHLNRVENGLLPEDANSSRR